MSATLPLNPIPRWSVTGMEGMFVKMWDPPTESPNTPDMIAPDNPVPEVLFAAGIATSAPPAPNTMTLDLLHGISLPTWDNPANSLEYFTVINPDIPMSAAGTFPSVTVRMPCGTIFHSNSSGKGPPPHTIHWHGMEPTPMNDGVGHCSMEIGNYTYQWQPTFIGTYFYHCHRNTMQHFEFGLYGLLLVEPADAYHATLVDSTIPIGHCRDGKRRTGANLQSFPQFPGWVGGDRTDPDPWTGNPLLRMEALNPRIGNINPHAMTVPYDVEGLWVFDDRDSNWSNNADHPHTAYPKHGNHPGYDDDFQRNPGTNGFFAFNDYRADYWFVTGVPIPAHQGGTGTIPAGIVVPAELNSGISGSQVSVEAYIGQTIFLRVLDAAYNNCLYTFPMDLVIVEWDGRPLGVPPYGFNEAYLVPANTPIEVSVGRRFGALVREFTPVNTFATCKFIDTRGANVPGFETVNCTARIPINISGLTVTATPNLPSPHLSGTPVVITAAMTGTPGSQAPTSGEYDYRFLLFDGTSWTTVQNYGNGATWTLPATTAPGSYTIAVDIRSNPNVDRDAVTYLSYEVTSGAATGVVITPDLPSPHAAGTDITFTAAGQGSANYDYRFWLFDGTSWAMVQNYGNGATWTLLASQLPGNYVIAVDVRTTSVVDRDAVAYLDYTLTNAPATGVIVTPSQPSPHPQGTSVDFTASGQGSANYDYQFMLHDGVSWTMAQDYGNGSIYTLPAATPAGDYTLGVNVRTSSAVDHDAAAYLPYTILP